MKAQGKRISRKLLFLPILVLAVLVGLFGFTRFEDGRPEAVLTIPGAALGPSQTLTIKAGDSGTGLRRIWIGFLKDGRETTLYERRLPAAGIFEGGTDKVFSADFEFDPAGLGLSDGKGIIRVLVEDYSWRNWGKGNRFYKETEVLIDTKPPVITVVSKAHYFSQGGAGLVVYSLSEDCRQSGVVVGDRFYPGHAYGNGDQRLYFAFVAVGYQQPPDTAVYLEAYDYAGNKAIAHFSHRINQRRFRKDRIRLTDSFLRTKVPELLGLPSVADDALLAGFLKINREMRKSDNATIARATSKSEDRILWQGAFLRMPHTAPKARFADHRAYIYKGKVIDHQVHMGIDLASVARSPVPAANRGRVVFCGKLGIYGNTVIIDHGMGLFSLYAHLSRVDVSDRQMVARGAPIGLTGRTGLAGGDHLHFSILVNGTFVNPIQWWDSRWVANNIIAKLKAYSGSKAGQ